VFAFAAWPDAAISAGFTLVGVLVVWIIRRVSAQTTDLRELAERIAYLEAKVNGKP
jgi:hypothetical protein